MLKGEQAEVMTPGPKGKNHLAGALDIVTGRHRHRVWFRRVNGLFVDLLRPIESACPATRYRHLYLVVDNYGIHKAQAVARWLAAPPRLKLIFLPAYCPQANPIARAFGNMHDECRRNHMRKRLRDRVAEVRRHFRVNGPCRINSRTFTRNQKSHPPSKRWLMRRVYSLSPCVNLRRIDSAAT